jgi:putative hydrolase of HD superfamily
MKQTTKRAGWLRKDVKDSESIADHMYRMGLMALIAPDFPGVDRDKLILISFLYFIHSFSFCRFSISKLKYYNVL